MKKFFSFVLLLVLSFPLVSSRSKTKPKKATNLKESRWTGHISMVETVTISAEKWISESKRVVQASFVNALPTLFRDDETTELDFSDDKGTGSHTYHAEETIGGRKCVTDCISTGKAELHEVVVDETNNIYHIEVISPECEGTTCADDGSPAPYNSTVSVQSLDEPLGTSKDVLAGTKTETGDLPGGLGKFTRTTSWHFVRGAQPDVELIVTPQNYDTWLPEPDRTTLTPGSVLNVSLKLQGRNGIATNKKVKSFELKLLNTSREPGITINFPVNSTNESADLKFLQQPDAVITDTASQGMVIMCRPARQTADFKIGAYDGGGWTILTADAILDDDTRVQGRLLVSNGETEIRIPKREPNSKIAEAWLKLYENPGEMDDKESSKGNSNNGDGFTAYEEYRGAIVDGKFKRFNPKRKELGIVATKADFALFDEGLGWFKTSSDLEPVRFDFDKDEIAPDGKLNMNKKTAHDYDQYALYLLNGGLEEGTLGIVYSLTNKPDLPAQIISVVADWNQIQGAYQKRVTVTRPDVLKFSLKEYLAQTVAHEMGHAVNIWHHGRDLRLDNYNAATEKYVPYTVNEFSDSIRIFDRHGNLIRTRPLTLFFIGAGTGTVESGDLSCMLNYYPYYKWGYTPGADGAFIYNEERLIPLGKTFCKSGTATDFNTTQLFFGAAARGNCLGQIKLRN